MFQEFTGKEYLKIDIANNFGLDKKSWDDRIAWFDQNEQQLSALVSQAEEPALFYAGLKAWEKAKNAQNSGYPISLDATCSGIQILAALACDRSAAQICNLVDTGSREDAYTSIYQTMVQKIGDQAKISRKMTKQAIMTAFYGSTAVPEKVFGDGELLNIFYETIQEHAPGAWEINETMLAIWDPTWTEYGWTLPDNFHVLIKVMGEVTDTVHFLNEPFEVRYSKNMPIEGGRALGANLVHSIDGMVVREMARRCMYDPKQVQMIVSAIDSGYCIGTRNNTVDDLMVRKLHQHYRESGFLSARILDHLCPENLGHTDPDLILKLIGTMPAKPFQVLSVHDCFRCLPNHGNDLRRQYNQILSEIASSDMLANLVSQIMGRKVTINKLDARLSTDIQQANYALS